MNEKLSLIFLDIDGVLNAHEGDVKRPEGQYNRIHHDKMLLLNHIIHATQAQVIISSAWRYMIHGKAMTKHGFEYMLISHGFEGAVLDYLMKDNYNDWQWGGGGDATRGLLIEKAFDYYKPNTYVVIDDLDLDISDRHVPFVQTDGSIGLTMDDVKTAIAYLT